MTSDPSNETRDPTMVPNLRYALQGPDLLDLWKYFEDQGNTVKGRMLTIVTWLLAFAAGILGFTAKELKVFDSSGGQPALALALSFVGLVICGYAFFLVVEFGNHMKRHWSSADWLMERIDRLGSIRNASRHPSKAPDDGLPGICKRVLLIVGGFVLMFAVVFILSL